MTTNVPLPMNCATRMMYRPFSLLGIWSNFLSVSWESMDWVSRCMFKYGSGLVTSSSSSFLLKMLNRISSHNPSPFTTLRATISLLPEKNHMIRIIGLFFKPILFKSNFTIIMLPKKQAGLTYQSDIGDSYWDCDGQVQCLQALRFLIWNKVNHISTCNGNLNCIVNNIATNTLIQPQSYKEHTYRMDNQHTCSTSRTSNP